MNYTVVTIGGIIVYVCFSRTVPTQGYGACNLGNFEPGIRRQLIADLECELRVNGSEVQKEGEPHVLEVKADAA